MKREKLCDLSINKAVEIVKQYNGKFMSKYGVWNSYGETTKENAINSILKSPYGADVYKDEDNTIYVSMPCSSDMW